MLQYYDMPDQKLSPLELRQQAIELLDGLGKAAVAGSGTVHLSPNLLQRLLGLPKVEAGMREDPEAMVGRIGDIKEAISSANQPSYRV